MCGSIFKQARELTKHSCTKLATEPEDTYARYTLKTILKAIIRLMQNPKITALEQYECFFEEKWAVPAMFPPLTMPQGGMRTVSYTHLTLTTILLV